MIDIKDVIPGKPYACHFRVGHYEGFGLLKRRDLENELVIVVDNEIDKEFVVPFADIWGIDDVEIIKEEP